MDGDQRMKQHERLMARSRNGTTGGRGIDHFDSAMNPRGDPTGMSQAPDRSQISYDYGYTGSSFHGGSLHPTEVPDPAEFARQRQSAQGIQHANPPQHPHQNAPQHQQQPIQQPRRRVSQDPSSFVPYESAMLYSFGGQGPAQGPFDVVPQYPARQTAAFEAMSNPYGVPQYFTPEEQPSVTGVPANPTYLNPQMPYNQPGPVARPITTQAFPSIMTEFTPIGTAPSSRLDPPPPQHQPDPPRLPPSDPPSLEEAYSYYQRSLRITFDHIRAGRLVEASRLLLEISDWLVTHARDLGILRDDYLSFPDRLNLWREFNICWLALSQKQKDLTQDYIVTGHFSSQIIPKQRMEEMGRDLIQLCDQLEQHGLVDYQMGIWEEEILCVLGQCLDLMESKPELHHMQAVPEPATAAPRS